MKSELPEESADAGGHDQGEVALQVMIETWRIQYQITQGMNTRIAALFAFTGILLGFVLGTEALRQDDALVMVGTGFLLASILALIAATRTREADLQPRMADIKGSTVVEVASYLDRGIEGNRRRLKRKSLWIHAAMAAILIAFTLLATAELSKAPDESEATAGAVRMASVS